MMDPYKSIYAKDLIPMIEHKALELMEEPIIQGKKSDGMALTLAEISHQNSLYAMFNSGLRMLATELINALQEEEAEKDD